MRTDGDRFDKVMAHPEYASAPTQPVLPADAGLKVAAVATPLIGTMVVALFLLVVLTIVFSFRPPLVLLVLAIGAVMALGMRSLMRGLLAIRDAPVDRTVAVIVKERTEVSTANDRASTSYYATLQTRDGQRVEYRVSSALAGKLVIDDIGIAYLRELTIDLGFTTIRSKTLVEFIRFDV